MKRLKKEDSLRIQYATRKPRPLASHSSLNLFKGAHLGPVSKIRFILTLTNKAFSIDKECLNESG